MLAKFLLPLLAAASAAVGAPTNNGDIASLHTTSVKIMGGQNGHLSSPASQTPGLHCYSLYNEGPNAHFSSDSVYSACINNLNYIMTQETIVVDPMSCWSVATDMCATKIYNWDPALNRTFASGILGNKFTESVLNSCIMNDSWGVWNGDGYSLSMEPSTPESPPASSKLEHSVTSQQVEAKGHIEAREDRNSTWRYLGHGYVNCTHSDRHLDNLQCNEAYNNIFDPLLWVDHVYLPKRGCLAANSTGNTCTACICNLSDEDATYYAEDLLDRFLQEVKWDCIVQQGKAGTWSDNQTSIFLG